MYFLASANINTVYAKVRDSNIVAHLYNTSLGFKRTKKIELSLGYEYQLSRDDYFDSTAILRKSSTIKLFGSKTVLEFNPSNPIETELKGKFIYSFALSGPLPDLEIV
jgi:hypothetical protein